MAVSAIPRKVREEGDGSKDDFDFTFAVNEVTDLVVYKIVRATDAATLQVLGVDYTVTLNAAGLGGTVTYISAPLVTEDSLIYSDTHITQDARLPTNGILRESQITVIVDKITMILQELAERIGRSIQIPITESDTEMTFDELIAELLAAQAAAEAAQTAAEAAQTAAEAAAASIPTLTGILQTVYPVGCTYVSYLSTSPATLFGFGTWVACGTGRMWVGYDAGDTDFNASGKQGGAKSQTVTSGNPSSSYPSAAGGGALSLADDSHKHTMTVPILSPYETVYKWKRTA